MTGKASKTATLLLPWLIGLLALALRLWGIRWGVPSADHAFSYHTDETLVLGSSLACHPLLLLLDPKFYAYGCLVPNVNGFFLDIGTWSGLLTQNHKLPPELLTCRVVTALFGAATCPALFLAGKRLYSDTAGLVAATLYAIAPLAVQHAHFATVDVHATFWATLCLAFCADDHAAKAARYSESRKLKLPGWLFWAGIFAGLAAAAKYNVGLVLLAPLVACLLPPSPVLHGGESVASLRAKRFGGTLLGALIGFLAGCPAVFTNPGGIISGLLREAGVSRTDHGGIFAGMPPAFLTHVLQSGWTLGLFLPFAIAVGLFMAIRRRSSSDYVLLAFVVPYYLMIGASTAMYSRYTLPLFPALLLLVGALATSKRSLILLGIISVPSVLLSGLLDVEMSQPDTRDRALVWIRAQNFSKIGFATGPWHYHPPLTPELTHPRPDKARESASVSGFLLPADGEWNAQQLKAENPDAVILSDAEYQYRTGPAKAAYLEALDNGWELAHREQGQLATSGITLTPRDARFPYRFFLPYDMGYPSPTIVVFSRR